MASWRREIVTQLCKDTMKKIAFLSQKGGSGKTTLVVHIAVAAHEAGERVAVINTDPQKSATVWGGGKSHGEIAGRDLVAKPDSVARRLARTPVAHTHPGLSTREVARESGTLF